MEISAASKAAITLLRDIADRLEKREVTVRSLHVGLAEPTDLYGPGDPIPSKLEILTVIPPPFQNNC